MTLVFLDTETTGLAKTAEVWEIGMIVQGHRLPTYDGEWLFQVRPPMLRAEPGGLRIGRFYERFLLDDAKFDNADAGILQSPFKTLAPTGVNFDIVARWVALLLDGAHMVGAVPSFDELRLGAFQERHQYPLTNHYHLIDVEALAVGYIKGAQIDYQVGLPWKSHELSAAIGVVHAVEDEHTALGDARWAKDIYDTIMGK